MQEKCVLCGREEWKRYVLYVRVSNDGRKFVRVRNLWICHDCRDKIAEEK